MKKGYIQVYTGNGKGKTTAAMGLALRAAGHGFSIKIIQFLKGGVSGELESIKKLETIELFRVTDAKRYIWDLTPEQKADMQQRSKEILNKTLVWFNQRIDILILDEIMAALQSDIVRMEDVLNVLDKKPEGTEIVLTGRNVPEEIAKRAHLISEVNDIKHYFDDGVPARKGIEF